MIAPAPYFNGFGASTAAESYQRGFADVVRSAGSANLMDSMAAQNYEQARSMDIQNRLQWTDAYYQMRKANRAYRESKLSPRMSQDEIMRWARVGLPDRPTATQLDPLTGQLNWPIILRDAQYADDREQLDKLFAERATSSSVSLDMYRQVQNTTNDLLAASRKTFVSTRPTTGCRPRNSSRAWPMTCDFPPAERGNVPRIVRITSVGST